MPDRHDIVIAPARIADAAKHRPEIDGLRAVAVVPVVFAHAGFAGFAGGFVGVDVFFVISGFLITSIIASDLDRSRFSLLSFYERRARRILPALFVVMICCIPFAWAFMVPWQFKDFSQSLIAVSLFASNIFFWMKSGYFGPAAQEMPLLHTWSLAVEEQFYLVFPLILIILHRFGRRVTAGAILIVALASFGLAELAGRNWASANFYLAPTRVWELLAGSLAALVPASMISRAGRIGGDLLATMGLAMILLAVFVFNETTPFPSRFTLVPVVGTALVLLFASPTTLCARLLSFRPIVFIGLISYSAYLWHQPLFAFARIRSDMAPGPGLMAALTVATFVLAYLTWRLVEQPFRAGRAAREGPDRLGRGRVFMASITGALVLAGIGVFGHVSNGRQALWLETVSPEIGKAYLLLQYVRGDGWPTLPDDGACRFNALVLNQQARDRILACHELYGSGYLLLGDSHAGDLFGAVVPETSDPFIVGVINGGCRVHSPGPGCAYGAIGSFIAQHPDVFDQIIYNQAGFYLLTTLDGAPGSRTMYSDFGPRQPVPSYPPNEAFISDVAAYLDELSARARVTWVGPAFEPHIGERSILSQGCEQPFALRPNMEAVADRLDTRIAEVQAERAPAVRYVSQMEVTGFDITRDFMTCSHLYWTDGDHWSADGQKRFGPKIAALLFDQVATVPMAASGKTDRLPAAP